MKRIVLAIMAAALMIPALVSCDKFSSGGSDTPEIYTDPLLLGAWNVVKYEALDSPGEVIETESTGSVIAETYHKFVFDDTGRMQCWFSVSAGQCITTNYSYFSLYGSLLFGDTGVAYVTTLDETSLVFTSDAFAPISWYGTTTTLKPGVSTVRVTCSKQTE